MGLIARRVGDLDEGLAKLSVEILAKSAAVVRLTKKAVRAGSEGGHHRGFSEALAESERLYLDELCPTADMAEGVAAFLEKRRPVWKHR